MVASFVGGFFGSAVVAEVLGMQLVKQENIGSTPQSQTNLEYYLKPNHPHATRSQGKILVMMRKVALTNLLMESAAACKVL